ncbi:alpha-1,2-fucosyltransferase [Calothrix sp. FACHB-156]|nr:alpha-1,2-fucosyltransferase [Calothrix sp. FACHB-156]
MIIVSQKTGQLANRLFLFSHLIANSVKYKYTLFNPTFDDYSSFFEATDTNYFYGYPIHLQPTSIPGFYLINRIFKKLIKEKLELGCFQYINLSWEKSLNISNTSFLEAAQKKIVVINGYAFRDFVAFQEKSDLIRDIFKPKKSIISNVEKTLKSLRIKGDVIIGIHIRRKDYKTYSNGVYYFDDDVYLTYIKKLDNIFNNLNKKVSFLICSDDINSIDTKRFESLNIYFSRNSAIEDLYILSRCDYLIGPPSSFTGWASFYGKVPLKHFSSQDEEINLNQFSLYPG